MRISRIIKDKDGYRLLCQFTMEDAKGMPVGVSVIKLLNLEFSIDNMASVVGFWFRPCSERHWGATGEYLVGPPSVEDGGSFPPRHTK